MAKKVELLYHFLKGGKPRIGKNDLELISQIFPEIEPTEQEWEKYQARLINILTYNYNRDEFNIRSEFSLIAENMCSKKDCPIKYKFKNPNYNSERDFYNLVVGPNGHFDQGDGADYVKILKSKIEPVSKKAKFYFFDPYLIKAQTKNIDGFAQRFINELKDEFSGIELYAVKKENYVNSPDIRIIDDKLLHDRFLIANDDNNWKGVLIGSSVTSYPTGSSSSRPHFIITTLEKEDAEKIGNILTTT
ncbi:MAG: hypothetical protein K2Q18_02435 [Bdellovibrionales bacterium]|nr:hypothetical protein [Bdellovibrionales bacterium]